eukprot:5504977-Amphidinium_carterae.1
MKLQCRKLCATESYSTSLYSESGIEIKLKSNPRMQFPDAGPDEAVQMLDQWQVRSTVRPLNARAGIGTVVRKPEAHKSSHRSARNLHDGPAQALQQIYAALR